MPTPVELIARAALFGLVGRSSTKIVQGGQVRKRRLMISTRVAPTLGAPPGGFMASSVDPTPSTNEAHGDSTPNTIVQDSEEDGDGFDHIDK